MIGCQNFLLLDSIIVLMTCMCIMSQQATVEKLEKENEMQDLTIGALKAMTSERFTSVEKNLEAINSGNERLFQTTFLLKLHPDCD